MMEQNNHLAALVSHIGEAARIKRIEATASYVGLSRASIYRLVKSGEFPTPVRLGPNSVGWTKEALDAWIDAKINEQAKH